MNTAPQDEITKQWAVAGMVYGFKNAIKGAYIYMSIPIVLGLVVGLSQIPTTLTVLAEKSAVNPQEWGVLLMYPIVAIIFTTFYFIFGTMLGVVPAAILGIVTGSILGAVLSLPHIAPYRWNRLAVGIGATLLLILTVNHFAYNHFVVQYPDDNASAYWFFVGVPSVVYLVVLARLSDRLPELVAEHAYVKEYPVRRWLETSLAEEEGV